MEGSNYWGYGYKTRHSYPRPEVKFGRNVVKEETTQHKNYQNEDKKSAIKKIDSQIKKPHLKMIPIKRQLELLVLKSNTWNHLTVWKSWIISVK